MQGQQNPQEDLFYSPGHKTSLVTRLTHIGLLGCLSALHTTSLTRVLLAALAMAATAMAVALTTKTTARVLQPALQAVAFASIFQGLFLAFLFLLALIRPVAQGLAVGLSKLVLESNCCLCLNSCLEAYHEPAEVLFFFRENNAYLQSVLVHRIMHLT